MRDDAVLLVPSFARPCAFVGGRRCRHHATSCYLRSCLRDTILKSARLHSCTSLSSKLSMLRRDIFDSGFAGHNRSIFNLQLVENALRCCHTRVCIAHITNKSLVFSCLGALHARYIGSIFWDKTAGHVSFLSVKSLATSFYAGIPPWHFTNVGAPKQVKKSVRNTVIVDPTVNDIESRVEAMIADRLHVHPVALRCQARVFRLFQCSHVGIFLVGDKLVCEQHYKSFRRHGLVGQPLTYEHKHDLTQHPVTILSKPLVV